MKLLRYGPAGEEKPALRLPDHHVVDVSDHVRDYDGPFFADDGLTRLQELTSDPSRLPVVDMRHQRVGAPIARPHQVLCIGLNYADHAAESGLELPQEPVLFNKAPNTVVGPYDDVLIPPHSTRTDWEVELAVVVGRRARYLPTVADATACVAGYAVSNDVSEREYQLERSGQWVKGKSCETFNPLGPWLVTPEEVPDVQALDMELDVNGASMQRGSTATMVFPVAHIVWYASQFMVLEPGDLINTGTPPGVGLGMDPPRYLRPDDVMSLRIERLGTQRQRVRQGTA